ncbi:MAG: helicase C-terminal domain-containing protein [Methanosarcinales archaeon]|nr:helicase C-terminal domain-containing protein [Methanosarcinales archaeon]
MCPDGHGFIPSGDKCEEKLEEDFQCSNIGDNLLNSEGPRLSIQDEMHLLREGFGTISAHFEGLIETIVEDQTKRKLKHIAMSATLNGTKKQIKELYNKKYFVIPGRCPEGAGSPNDFFFEKKEGPKRIIYGLKPNLRDNHYASLRTLLHFGEFIIDSQKNLNSDLNNFCDKYDLKNPSEAQDLLNQYLVPLTYHIKKQDAYDMGRLDNAVVGDTLKDHFGGSDIHGTVLTGDSGLEELKETIDKVRDFVKNYNPKVVDDEGLLFEPIYATSVVSHGVDLDELNFMAFQGLPYSTSEYIQALSRVGRKNLGIILLWFYPNRVRDESFFRNFVRYHNSLDHEVRPVPINRFSKLGLMQTINSLFCAGILNYLSNKKGKPLYHKRDVMNLTSEDREDLENFIESAYGKKSIDITISDEIDKRISEIVLGKDNETQFFPKILSKSGNPFFHTQSGMRGIQKNLALDLNPKDERILKQMEK